MLIIEWHNRRKILWSVAIDDVREKGSTWLPKGLASGQRLAGKTWRTFQLWPKNIVLVLRWRYRWKLDKLRERAHSDAVSSVGPYTWWSTVSILHSPLIISTNIAAILIFDHTQRRVSRECFYNVCQLGWKHFFYFPLPPVCSLRCAQGYSKKGK